MKKIFKNSLFTFILGAVIFSCLTVYGTEIFYATQVGYTPQIGSFVTATNVQSALDQLYTKVGDTVDLSAYGVSLNSSKKIIATSSGIIIRRNEKTHLIRNNNWSEEKEHLKQIYSDVGMYDSSTGFGCDEGEYGLACYANDFECHVNSNGVISCIDVSDNSRCLVDETNVVSCT